MVSIGLCENVDFVLSSTSLDPTDSRIHMGLNGIAIRRSIGFSRFLREPRFHFGQCLIGPYGLQDLYGSVWDCDQKMNWFL